MSKQNKMKLCRAHVEQWQGWRDANMEPVTRAAAIEIVKDELAAAGIDLDASLVSETLAIDHMSDDGAGVIDSALSFMVWDLTQNDGKALDYSRDTNYFRGLVQQARLVITAYTRVNLTVGSHVISTPQFVSVKGRGLQPITRINAQTLEEIANREISAAHAAMRRWKTLGASKQFVAVKLQELTVKVLAEFDATAAA